MEYKEDEKLEEAKKLYETANSDQKYVLESLFPQLSESEDDRIRKALIDFFGKGSENGEQTNGIYDKDILAWLEKQGEQKPIMNVPAREVILAIWDLGSEWKELTGGSISTEYGIQLEYIQKHWEESEYYLREKQSEQKSALGEEDEKCQLSCFESALFTAFSDAWQSYLLGEKVNVKQWAKEHSKELLEAAKEELKVHNSTCSEEDKMIKKSLINYVYCHGDAGDFTKKEFISWLENIKAPSLSKTDKSFINDIKSIINEAPGVFQSDKNRLITWLEKQVS